MPKKFPEDPDLSYMNPDGKIVAGSAAFLHVVYTECDGVKSYNDMVGEGYVKEFLSALSPTVNAKIEADIKRKRLKFVD